MMRKSKTCAPHAGAIVAGFVPQSLPAIVEQASFPQRHFVYSLQQVAHQRKEQP
jgi:hypothetical protein